MKYPKISIVTPSFNHGDFIEETILSVLEQNYPNLEYIIIDGGSQDQSLEIIRKYQKHLHYWISEPDKGQSDALNKGIAQASGDIFNWVNSDDFYEDGAFACLAAHFEDPRIQVVAGLLNRVDHKGKRLNQDSSLIWPDNPAKTSGTLIYQQLSTFFRLDVFQQLGPLSLQLHYAMDLEMWLRYLLTNGVQNIQMADRALVNFRVHDHSKTGSDLQSLLRERNSFYYFLCKRFHSQEMADLYDTLMEANVDKNYQMNPGDIALLPPEIEEIMAYFYLHKAEIHYARGRYKNCLSFLKAMDKSYLQGEDIALFERLLLRSRFPFLIETGRQIRKIFST